LPSSSFEVWQIFIKGALLTSRRAQNTGWASELLPP
jgi:hypothetical protein